MGNLQNKTSPPLTKFISSTRVLIKTANICKNENRFHSDWNIISTVFLHIIRSDSVLTLKAHGLHFLHSIHVIKRNVGVEKSYNRAMKAQHTYPGTYIRLMAPMALNRCPGSSFQVLQTFLIHFIFKSVLGLFFNSAVGLFNFYVYISCFLLKLNTIIFFIVRLVFYENHLVYIFLKLIWGLFFCYDLFQ